MLSNIKRKIAPAAYQGEKSRPVYFEGWYLKLADRAGEQLLAVIPGVFKGRDSKDSHSFIQIFNGTTARSVYYRFPFSAFESCSNTRFEIRIADNHFSDRHLSLNLGSGTERITGEINFGRLNTWPCSLLSPGIMGWYTWVPFMECYHGVLSLDHEIEGRLFIGSRSVDFSRGRGYIEKDWGRAFPEAWIWLQSNHFKADQTSFMGSIAIIPWIGRPFSGFLFGLLHNDTLYRFTTYTGARMTHLSVNEKQVSCVVEDKEYELAFSAPVREGGRLYAPSARGMTRVIRESLQSEIDVRLTQKNKAGQQTIIHDTGKNSGFESAGDLEKLLRIREKA